MLLRIIYVIIWAQGRILAVWISAAKLPNSDLNFAVDFGVDFSSCFSKEKGPTKSPQNSPRNLFGKIHLGFLQKHLRNNSVNHKVTEKWLALWAQQLPT